MPGRELGGRADPNPHAHSFGAIKERLQFPNVSPRRVRRVGRVDPQRVTQQCELVGAQPHDGRPWSHGSAPPDPGGQRSEDVEHGDRAVLAESAGDKVGGLADLGGRVTHGHAVPSPGQGL